MPEFLQPSPSAKGIPPRETILLLVQKTAIQNLGVKISIDVNKQPRRLTKLRNRFNHLVDIKLASTDCQTE